MVRRADRPQLADGILQGGHPVYRVRRPARERPAAVRRAPAAASAPRSARRACASRAPTVPSSPTSWAARTASGQAATKTSECSPTRALVVGRRRSPARLRARCRRTRTPPPLPAYVSGRPVPAGPASASSAFSTRPASGAPRSAPTHRQGRRHDGHVVEVVLVHHRPVDLLGAHPVAGQQQAQHHVHQCCIPCRSGTRPVGPSDCCLQHVQPLLAGRRPVEASAMLQAGSHLLQQGLHQSSARR